MSELYINGKKIFDDAKIIELEDKVDALEARRYIGTGTTYPGDIVFSETSPVSITIADDGILAVSWYKSDGTAGNSMRILMNGETIYIGYKGNILPSMGDVDLPVKKGDVLTFTANQGSITWAASLCLLKYKG